MNNDLHPSGMPWERWNNPFKTAEERKLVIKYFQKCQRDEKETRRRMIEDLGPALL